VRPLLSGLRVPEWQELAVDWRKWKICRRASVQCGPGSGLVRGRKRFLCQLPLWFCIYLVVRAHFSVFFEEVFRVKNFKYAHGKLGPSPWPKQRL
jgi:hypothetical protein